jgi:dTDP-4-dehydrorhamnose reductase
MELWGGPECTIVRLGDRWRDQVRETGHRDRPADLDLVAGLGIRTLRYPILWENVAPDRSDRLDFAWSDERLSRLEARGIEVIGGLLHHGSGPRYTHLLDPDFPARFADYAARVAERYPQIRRWTPVNEPLTTARFSALYGHWYPHRRDYPAFLRAVVNQCQATRLAMAAVRKVNPDAELVQTEDLGKTFATPSLIYQADHENDRRWLSLDLLAGMVRPGHPMYSLLIEAGVGADEIALFADKTAIPDVIGVNYYLTSERFLDERIHLHPDHDPGGNGRDRYVDAEAVRAVPEDPDLGLGPRLHEAWTRYAIPLAITEVHHGCTRDEQLRWFAHVWRTAEGVRREGVDVRAVTLWSLFGCVDWRSLLTRDDGVYDAGAFDIRASVPRPTALARAAAELASGRSLDHPVLDTTGWWHGHGRWRAGGSGREARKLLITGATGTLGQALSRVAGHRGLAHHLTSRAELDICDPGSIAAAIAAHRPWAIINAAGFVRVMEAEDDPEACMAANAKGPALLAAACFAAGIPLVTFSSDLVFDGTSGAAYRESDRPGPIGVYGASKAEAERAILATGGWALIIRTSAFFGPWDRHNFASHVLAALGSGKTFRADARTRVSPTFVPDLCHAALDLLIDGETGLWHLANEGDLSWHEFARRIAEGAGFDPMRVIAVEQGKAASTALVSERGQLLRPLDQAIAAYLRETIPEALPIAAE